MKINDFNELKEAVDRKIRWIPSWKKKRIKGLAVLCLCLAGLLGITFGAVKAISSAVNSSGDSSSGSISTPGASDSFFGNSGAKNLEPVMGYPSTHDLRKLVSVPIASAGATSFLSGKYNSYGPENAIDGDITTSWQEGVLGYGIGESIILYLDGEKTITDIYICPGSFKSAASFEENGHLNEALFEFSDGSSFIYSFPNNETPSMIELSRPEITSFVKLTIVSVYEGTTWEDTVVSEISLYGKQ